MMHRRIVAGVLVSAVCSLQTSIAFAPPHQPLNPRRCTSSSTSSAASLWNTSILLHEPRAYRDIISRRATSTPVSTTTTTENESQASNSTPNVPPDYPLVILIGGSGFLGSEIRKQLQERGVNYIATCTPATANKYEDSDEKFMPLDLTAGDAEEQFYQLITSHIQEAESNQKVAVISAMGSIGTDQDEAVNSAQTSAIRGANRVNNEVDETGGDVVERFVVIGNTERVRRLARNVPFLQAYASGKDEAESSLRECFGSRGCIIKPSFIYGGDKISLQPPRLPSNLGGLASEVLGLYPFQALADGLPDAFALPLAAPVSVELVASAVVNVALGIVEGYTDELEGEAIYMAATVRSRKEKSRYEAWLREELKKDGIEYTDSSKDSCSIDAVMEVDDERRWKRIDELKEQLLHGSVSDGDDIEIMEELECLRPQSMKPANDPKLNGQWDFVLSKDDLGTQLIKEFLGDSNSSPPPLKTLLDSLYQLKGLFMRISDEQSRVEIVLSSSVCFGQIPIDIVFETSLLSTNYDEETDGTLFLEKFESITVGSIPLPLPESWQRFRYLEITYLDDDIVIARGSGGEPHVLVRAKY